MSPAVLMNAPRGWSAEGRGAALIALHAAAITWGSQHAVIKGVIDQSVSPGLTNAVRFGIAATVSLSIAPSVMQPIFADDRAGAWANTTATWTAGTELGVWMFLGYAPPGSPAAHGPHSHACPYTPLLYGPPTRTPRPLRRYALQAIGLQFTSASRSAFLLYLNVKLVPLLGYLFFRRTVPPSAWLSAAIALCGTILITSDGSPPNVGDAWSLAAAAVSALFILRLETATRDPRLGAATELNAAMLTVVALLCALWAAGEAAMHPDAGGGSPVELLQAQAGPLLYLALLPTVATNWLQTFGQRRINAQDAAVIFALDPVYGAFFAYLLQVCEIWDRSGICLGDA